MQNFCLVIIFTFAMPSLAIADNYEISITRKGTNLYKIDDKNTFIHTRYCYEYVYYESSFLKMSGYSGEIIFTESGGRCGVEAVYAPSEQKAGKYAVTINRKDNDWYDIWGRGIYIKTSGCLSLALGEEAILFLRAGGYGTLYVESNECMVEDVYSRIKL